MKNSELFEDMQSGKSFCFVGDSITYGSVTGGIPWYEHLKPYIKGEIMEYACGGWTSRDIYYGKKEIPTADIYVIAIGINDILLDDETICAADEEEYIDNLDKLSESLKDRSPNAKFYFITPWIFLDFPAEYYERSNRFSDALKDWCNNKDRICIDPNPFIESAIKEDGQERYMFNSFHPNAHRGVGLFSYAVLDAEHQRRLQSHPLSSS